MTFKEELTKMADKETPDISERIAYIKELLEKAYRIRHFTIDLIYMHASTWTTPEGQLTDDMITLLIPRDVHPGEYVRAFDDELRKLGFTDKDMTRKVIRYDGLYDKYRTILTW